MIFIRESIWWCNTKLPPLKWQQHCYAPYPSTTAKILLYNVTPHMYNTTYTVIWHQRWYDIDREDGLLFDISPPPAGEHSYQLKIRLPPRRGLMYPAKCLAVYAMPLKHVFTFPSYCNNDVLMAEKWEKWALPTKCQSTTMDRYYIENIEELMVAL